MAKLTLNNITSGHASTTLLNANNDAIEAALENTLSRDGTSPNSMEADFDMNSYRVLNLPEPILDSEPATKGYADEAAGGLATVPVTSVSTTTYTIDDEDMNTWIQFTANSAITVTLNSGVGEAGKSVLLEQVGSGQITVSGSATVRAANGKKSMTTNSVICLFCTSAGSWNCFGDTTT